MDNTELTHEHEFALKLLAKEKLQAIRSLGTAADASFVELIFKSLRDSSENEALYALELFELVKRHTYKKIPKKSGMYLKLSHGRSTLDSVLSDWGSDGPYLGPLSWFHSTYLTDMGMSFDGSDEVIDLSPTNPFPSPIYFVGSHLYYEGIYYGDWSVEHIHIKKRKK